MKNFYDQLDKYAIFRFFSFAICLLCVVSVAGHGLMHQKVNDTTCFFLISYILLLALTTYAPISKPETYIYAPFLVLAGSAMFVAVMASIDL